MLDNIAPELYLLEVGGKKGLLSYLLANDASLPARPE